MVTYLNTFGGGFLGVLLFFGHTSVLEGLGAFTRLWVWVPSSVFSAFQVGVGEHPHPTSLRPKLLTDFVQAFDYDARSQNKRVNSKDFRSFQ